MRFTRPKFPALMLLVAAAGHSISTSAQTDSPVLASIRKAGEVKVALGSAPPYVVFSPNGSVEGYTVDVVNLVLKGMGLPALTPVQTDFSAQIPALQARRVDIVAPGLTITEAGCKAVVFSGPTFAMRAGLYVVPGNPKHVTSVSKIVQSTDIKVAVIAGSSGEAYVLKQGVKPDQLVRVTDIQAGAATVTGGRADTVLLGQFTIPNPEKKGLELVVDEKGPVYGYGAAFRKEDVRFRDAFNEQLNLLRSNGTLKKLYADKYGVSNWETLAKLTKASDTVPGCE